MELVQEKDIRLSPKMMPKQLKDGEIKIYKLTNAGEVDHTTTNESTGRPITKVNPYYISEGVESVYDKFEEDPYKRNKIIKNVTGTELKQKDGRATLEDKVEDIEFVNSVCVVRSNEPGKYLFLERSNYNKSNPFRDKKKPAVWEAVEGEKEIAEILAIEEIKDDAILILRGMNVQEMQACAKGLGVVSIDKKTSDELRWDLRQKALKDPKEFIMKSKNAKAIRRLQIADAKLYKIIAFDEDSGNWIWPSEKDDKRVVCSVPVGRKDSPEDFLDEFLVENKAFYQKMVTAIKHPEDFL